MTRRYFVGPKPTPTRCQATMIAVRAINTRITAGERDIPVWSEGVYGDPHVIVAGDQPVTALALASLFKAYRQSR